MSRKIGMREFRKNFKLHLLNSSSENFQPGHRVDFGLIVGNERFQVKQESIVRELGISNDRERELAQNLKNIELSDASFAQLEITRDFMIDGDLDIPSIPVDLRGKIEIDKVVRMNYGGVKVREIIDGDVRDEIEDLMEDVKTKGGKPWRKLKRKGITLKLFYSDSVSIDVERKIDFDVNIEVEVSDVGVSIGADGNDNTKYKYSFGSNKCPFAVYFESVREFIE